MRQIDIHPDIRRASTLPAWAYSDEEVFVRSRERIFTRSWQLAGDSTRLRVPGQVTPFLFLEGCLDEPLLLTRDADDRIHCLSNVCTHRGALVCDSDATLSSLRCRYHGRRFALDGQFLSMPEFDGVENFPSPADNLPQLPLERWKQFIFVSLDPAVPFQRWIAAVDERTGWLPIEHAVLDPARSREYLVRANWALYCDNYLEGFHLPYVHPGLAGALDYGAYRTELFDYSSLQVGISRGGDAFDLPAGHRDHGQRIAAYYFWLFPNLMLNFYPWGISVNLVTPLERHLTRISFLSYVWDASRLDLGASESLDRVEREDEAIVESVQTGINSRLYNRGRYSATREQNVHHFHRLLAAFLNGSEPARGAGF